MTETAAAAELDTAVARAAARRAASEADEFGETGAGEDDLNVSYVPRRYRSATSVTSGVAATALVTTPTSGPRCWPMTLTKDSSSTAG